MAGPFGAAPGIMLGVGVGTAAAAALEPLVEPGRQQAWSDHPNRVLDPGLMARLVAEGGVPLGVGRGQARREGINADRFDTLVWLAQRLPDIGLLDKLSNRQLITPDEVEEALTRHGLPDKWHAPLVALFSDLLSPGELAAAIHRGLIPDPGILLGEQPSGPRNVASYPVQPIDAVREAAGTGFDKERLAVLVGLQGLPMGVIEAAHAYYRDILTHGDYIAAFNESNNRNEWAEAVLEYARQIPTARDFFENALRGYHSLSWAQEQAKRHGMTPEDSLVIYQNQGRPMNVRQITQALARGGKFKPEPGELTDPYDAAIVEGNLKPAYYDLAKANRYTLPSYFVIRAMVAAGSLTAEEAAQLFKEEGWPPDLADKAAAALAPASTAATKDPWVAKADQQLWTAIHRAYVKVGNIDDAQADSYLSAIVENAVDRFVIVQRWQTEKNLGGIPRVT